MNREPERPIEQSLRDYGQSRVEQAAPAELHPATRVMLQGEVTRAITKPLAESSEEAMRNFARPFASTPHQPHWLARFWPRLAFGGTVLAAFALVVSVLQNEQGRTKRAQDERGWFAGESKTAPPATQPVTLADSLPASRGEADGVGGVDSLPLVERERAVAGGRVSPAAPALAPKLDKAVKELAADDRELARLRPDTAQGTAPTREKLENGLSVAFQPLNQKSTGPQASGAPAGGAGKGGFTGGVGGTSRGASRPEVKSAGKVLTEAVAPVAPVADLPKLEKFAMETGARAGAAPALDARRASEKRLSDSPAVPAQIAQPARPDSSTVTTLELAAAKPAPAPQPVPAADAGKPLPLDAFARAESTTATPRAAGVVAPGSVSLPALSTATPGDAAATHYFYSVSALRQEFSQEESQARLRRNFQSPRPSPVLVSFRFERSGESVVITDADGSTYWGSVVEAPVDGFESLGREVRDESVRQRLEESKKARELLADKAEKLSETDSKRKAADAAVTPMFYFRTTGTNRTLNQPVVFSGSFVPMQTESEDRTKLGVAAGTAENKGDVAMRLKKQDEMNELSRSRLGGVGRPPAPSRTPLTPASGPAAAQSYGISLAATNVAWSFQKAPAPSAPRVQGTAVIGKDRLEINATPKK